MSKNLSLLFFVKKVDPDNNINYVVRGQSCEYTEGELTVHEYQHDPKRISRVKFDIVKKDESQHGHIEITKILLDGDDVTHTVGRYYTYASPSDNKMISRKTYLYLAFTGTYTLTVRYAPMVFNTIDNFLQSCLPYTGENNETNR